VVIARKGILATTVSDIAAEAGRSTASFYNYYDSKESMVREWAQLFLKEARERVAAAGAPGLDNRARSYEAVAAHWHTYRNRLAEIIAVSQLAMVNDDFAAYWDDLCALPIAMITSTVERAQRDGYCVGSDPKLVAIALVSMLHQFCCSILTGNADSVDDDACITTLADVCHRTIYHKETGAA